MQVVVGKYSQIVEADYARMRLSTHGIESHLENERASAPNTVQSNPSRGIQLVVMEEDALLAKQTIDTLQ